MDSDTVCTMDSSSSKLFGYHKCITVYPLLIKRIISHCDVNQLLNEYIFQGDNAHHEKYMITNSGIIENAQFAIYFTNQVSAETIYETMKPESIFSCAIPRKPFLTSPNKDQFIPQTMRSWKWKKELNLHEEYIEYSFKNCYQIEHAIENKHDTAVLAIKDKQTINDNNNKGDENHDTNNTKKRKKRKQSTESHDEYVLSWHLIIFNSEFTQTNKNVENCCKTEQIAVLSETCHQGMITNIDWNKKIGYVRNKKWKSIHQFMIDGQHETVIKENQLISYTLSIPKSCYVTSDPIKATDCIGNNIDFISKTPLCRRRKIKYPDKLNNFGKAAVMKLALYTPTASSTEKSPIMFLSPKRRNNKYEFARNQPKRRHSVTSTCTHGQISHHRSKSRFVVNNIGRTFDTDDLDAITQMLVDYPNSTPFRVHNIKNAVYLQTQNIKNIRNISREVSVNIDSQSGSQPNSPSSQFVMHSPLSPLSEIGSDNDSDNITSSINEPIENSESRKKSEKLWLMDMNSWNDREFKEFLISIGEKQFVDIFIKNGVKPNHLLVANAVMLAAMNLPPMHIRNIILQRDYYKNSDRILRSLDKLDFNKETKYKLECLLNDLKDIQIDSRIKRLRLQKLKCRTFAVKHHDVVQIIKEYIEMIENRLENKNGKNKKAFIIKRVVNNNNIEKKEEFQETNNGYNDKEGSYTEEKQKEHKTPVKQNQLFALFREEKDLVFGCNKCGSNCIGLISLQLMNVSYIKYNFGENSVGLVMSDIEKQLIEKINTLLFSNSSLRVNIYKNTDLSYYTLIIYDKDNNNGNDYNKDCLGFKRFTNFLKYDLTEIGFKIPMFWNSLKNGQYHKKKESEQLEGIIKRNGLHFDTSDIEYSLSAMSKASISLSDKGDRSDRSDTVEKIDKHLINHSPTKSKTKSPSKSKSKFKSLRKSLKKRLSISSKRKNKKKYKSKSVNCKNELGDVDELQELRKYGLDNFDNNSFLSQENEIYFMIGSIYIGMVKANLYQEIQKVRKTIHKNLVNHQSNDDNIIKVSSVNDLCFVKRL